MGIQTPSEYNGSECNFLTAVLIVEELSKVDPSVAALVDIHNTLVNSVFFKYANEAQKNKYLPKLSTEMVTNNYVFCVYKPFQDYLSIYKGSW